MQRTISKIAHRLNFGYENNRLPSLVLVTDSNRQPDPLETVSRLPNGSAVLFRHYSCPRRRDLALALQTICRARALYFIVSNDIDLALEVSADGLHLPEYRLSGRIDDIHKWRQYGGGLLTAAVHSQKALIKALRLNVDAVFLSPVFHSASHPKRKPLGLMRFTKICKSIPLPIYALGGINEISSRRLVGSGAVGIAAVGAMINQLAKQK